MLWGGDAAPGKEMTACAAASRDDPGLLNWYPSTGSADADLLPGLGTIRPRSRDLERNNGYGSGANQSYKDNIVGHQLRLNANPDALLLGWKHEEAKHWGLFTNAQFATWANNPIEVDWRDTPSHVTRWPAIRGWVGSTVCEPRRPGRPYGG